MEAVIDILRAMQLSLLQALAAGAVLFGTGWFFGRIKVRKLDQEVDALKRDILDLNEELLYPPSETPVIGIRQDKLKNAKLAK